MKLFIKVLNEKAKKYYQNHGHYHKGDAGLDLYVLNDVEFGPGQTKLIKLGISCQPEDGLAYFLMPRSSISKTPLRMSNSVGLIDGGYRGEIMACCDNVKNTKYSVKEGERLFQLVSPKCSPIEYELREELIDSSRGSGGFGSTGK